MKTARATRKRSPALLDDSRMTLTAIEEMLAMLLRWWPNSVHGKMAQQSLASMQAEIETAPIEIGTTDEMPSALLGGAVQADAQG